ncbi:hypothetical protein GCK32_011845 [Trichostrongylus colubriformis]|uniref:SH3 domain-containing protein n=1 Tax=Trichostrongylus colubriformis TaxID=6319 RepID=A0AAN8FLS8_TRICO
MSLFNRIISIGDVLARLPQLDAQVDKLEAEDLLTRDNKQLRRSFTKRCHDLYKQERLLRIAPERDRISSDATSLSRSGEDGSSGRSTGKPAPQEQASVAQETSQLSAQETPVMLPPQPPPRIERAAPVPRAESVATTTRSTAGVPSEGKTTTSGAENEQTMFVAMADLAASEASDLSIVEGELLRIIQTRPDGWWTARNAKGDVGLVPKTYLRQATTTDGTRIASEGTREVMPV